MSYPMFLCFFILTHFFSVLFPVMLLFTPFLFLKLAYEYMGTIYSYTSLSTKFYINNYESR
jgi:hypothetical protein